MSARSARAGYERIAVAAPVTVPYRRYSIRSAHWWLARALDGLLGAAATAGCCSSTPSTSIAEMFSPLRRIRFFRRSTKCS